MIMTKKTTVLNINKTFAYVRVSTKEQNTDRQLDTLKQYVTSDRDIFIDKESGKDFNRPQYLALKATLRQGDTLYIKSLDRLGRNKVLIKKELEYFYNEGITVRCLDIPTTLMDLSAFGDFQKAIMEMINNILIEVLGTIAEQERKTIKQRQQEGIESAHKRNVKFGRPKIKLSDTFMETKRQWLQQEITAVEAMKREGMSKATFYRYINNSPNPRLIIYKDKVKDKEKDINSDTYKSIDIYSDIE